MLFRSRQARHASPCVVQGAQLKAQASRDGILVEHFGMSVMGAGDAGQMAKVELVRLVKHVSKVSEF